MTLAKPQACMAVWQGAQEWNQRAARGLKITEGHFKILTSKTDLKHWET